MKYIDINCDVGEGVGNEASILPLVSSCNIACGGHAGDANTMSATIRLALKNNVKIGAHPSYPDTVNFGRIKMDISSEELTKSLQEQLTSFNRIVEREGALLHHLKPHGALYNAVAKEVVLAHLLLDVLEDYKEVPIYVPYQSVIHKIAIERGFKFYLEAFADRNYNADLQLVSRSSEKALIQQPVRVLEHLKRMVQNNAILTVEGHSVEIRAQTYCIHGDTPSALEILTYLHQNLPNQNIQILR